MLLRALLFGAGAALIGLVAAAARWDRLPLVGIAVGLLIGYAVRKGARGRGGWRYQALAMVLTCPSSIYRSRAPYARSRRIGFDESALDASRRCCSDQQDDDAVPARSC